MRTGPFPGWPIWDNADEQAVIPVLRRGRWSRDKVVNEAEQLVKETVGSSQHVLLATKRDMDDIVDGVEKVYEHRKALMAAT